MHSDLDPGLLLNLLPLFQGKRSKNGHKLDRIVCFGDDVQLRGFNYRWGLCCGGGGRGGSWNSRDVINNSSGNLRLCSWWSVQLCVVPNWPICEWVTWEPINPKKNEGKHKNWIKDRCKITLGQSLQLNVTRQEDSFLFHNHYLITLRECDWPIKY